MLLQLLIGIITYRTTTGKDVMRWLINFALAFNDTSGAKFLFGPNESEHYFAFQVGSYNLLKQNFVFRIVGDARK